MITTIVLILSFLAVIAEGIRKQQEHKALLNMEKHLSILAKEKQGKTKK